MGGLMDMIADPEHRALFDWWLSARGAREMPSRSDFDPLDHPGLLPRLFIVDVNPLPPHFRYRLCGTEIDEQQGYPMTGRTFEDLFEGELYRFTQERFADVAFHRRISYHTTYFTNDNTAKRSRFTRLLLPMSEDGDRIDTVLGSRTRVSDFRRNFDELDHDAKIRRRYEIAVVPAAEADRAEATALERPGCRGRTPA
ncbi:MAG: PAS domain-containing protein [Thalassobaculum sp.]|uniref:PAS domain-containing protein n=1 Tax=Thalassobaculum sp. TaxID=2022740 RepID=UPI0032EC8E6C